MVVDGEESYTANQSQQRHNDSLTAQGLAPLKSWQWKAVVEKKACRGRRWRMLRKDQFLQGLWEYFSIERLKAKKFLKDAEKEKHEGIEGQWQQKSPVREYLEQVMCCADTDCTPRMMKYEFFA